MKKKVGIIKRVLCLCLVFLLSINSFAAIVSDNDGSAFITKAEFDALKNSFQTQIDTYNTSIDSKIDGAIASYLAGINLVTEEPMECPVENYKDIMWINDWKLYGNYKHFSCNTISSVDVNRTNVWFTPPREERVVTRSNNCYFGTIGRSWGNITMGVIGTFTFSNQPVICGGAGDSAEIFAIRLKSESDQTIDNTTPFVNVRGMTNFYRAYGQSNGCYDAHWGASIGPTGKVTTYADTATEKVLSFGMEIYINNTSTRQTINNYVRTNNTTFPATYGAYNAFDATTYNRTAITSTGGDTYGTLSKLQLNGGITAVQLNSTYQANLVNYANLMMFGNDINTEVNTYTLVANSDLLGGTQYVVDNSRTVSGTYRITTVYSSSGQVYNETITTHATNTVTGTVSHTLTIPLLPKIQIKNLSSGKVKDSGLADLKYGQGIPIVKKLSRKGIVKLKIYWDIPNILGTGTTVSDQSFKLDLKDADFLSSTGEYIKGCIGKTSPIVEFNDYRIDSTSKSTEIYIDANAGDNIWLRMKPNSTTDGICAKITNMEISWLSE